MPFRMFVWNGLCCSKWKYGIESRLQRRRRPQTGRCEGDRLPRGAASRIRPTSRGRRPFADPAHFERRCRIQCSQHRNTRKCHELLRTTLLHLYEVVAAAGKVRSRFDDISFAHLCTDGRIWKWYNSTTSIWAIQFNKENLEMKKAIMTTAVLVVEVGIQQKKQKLRGKKLKRAKMEVIISQFGI